MNMTGKITVAVLALVIGVAGWQLGKDWTPGAMNVDSTAPTPAPLSASEQAKANAGNLYDGLLRQRAAMGAQAIGGRLRDPGKLTWVSVFAGRDGSVCFEYVAVNAFGGPARGYGVLPLNSNEVLMAGETWRRAWNAQCTHGGRDLTAWVKRAM